MVPCAVAMSAQTFAIATRCNMFGSALPEARCYLSGCAIAVTMRIPALVFDDGLFGSRGGDSAHVSVWEKECCITVAGEIFMILCYQTAGVDKCH